MVYNERVEAFFIKEGIPIGGGIYFLVLSTLFRKGRELSYSSFFK
jgi:hypothetical protein